MHRSPKGEGNRRRRDLTYEVDMNNTERDAAIDDLIRRVEALEAAAKEPANEPAEGTDVRNEENSQPGEQG